MNCVAISTSEEKPKLQFLHNELSVTTPTQMGGANNYHGNNNININNSKTQSLQRTTHLYCRSLEKDRSGGDRRTSRGLTSCLRGERDEFLDYRDLQPMQQQQLHQLQIQQPQPIDADEIGGGGGGSEAGGLNGTDSGACGAGGRSKFKNKKLKQ